MVRVILPYHLKTLAKISGEVELDVPPPLTLRAVLEALESRYPMLCGTIRDQTTGVRRPMVRFFACEQDFSNEAADVVLPTHVATGVEPLLVIGAIAGG